MRNRLWVSCLYLFGSLLICPLLCAQLETGSITGVVSDPSGAAIPSAKVSIKNQATNVVFPALTDAAGFYSAPQLPPAVYTITVRATGFSTAVRPDVEVRVNDQLRVDFNLQVGAVTQTVEVKGEAPLLQTQGATAGQVVDSKQTIELPLNGRYFMQLATLAPTTVTYPVLSGVIPQNTYMNLGGARTNQVNNLLQGIDDTAFSAYSAPMIDPPIDSLQEFKIETNDSSVETARLAGAVVNATIKSGSNAFHGTAYDFLRNNVFNARNFFATTAATKPEFTRNQAGASLGGAFIKNKLFFFLNYEANRQRQNAIYTTEVFTASQVAGNFSSALGAQIGTDSLGRPVYKGEIYNPFTVRAVTAGAADPVTGLVATSSGNVRDPYTGNQVTNISPIVQKVLADMPLPNYKGNVNYLVSESNPLDTDTYVGRIDWAKSERNTIESYFVDGALAHTAAPVLGLPLDGGYGANSTSQTWTQRLWGLGWTHIFRPTDLNELRVAYVRSAEKRYNFLSDTDVNSEFGIPYGFPGDNYGGLADLSVSGFQQIGVVASSPFFQYIGKYQINDTYTAIRGPHTLKFGFWYLKSHFYNQYNCNYCRGYEVFDGVFTRQVGFSGSGSSAADFLAGVADTAEDASTTNGNYKGIDIEGFAQDEWHATKKLSITAGLRYQFDPSIWVSDGRASSVTFGPNFSNPQVVVPSNMSSYWFNQMANVWFPFIPVVRGNNLTNGLTGHDLTGWAPRLGIAYQLTPKTVIRAGWGVFHAFNDMNSGVAITVNPPEKETVNLSSNTVNPNIVIAQNPFGANPLGSALVNPGFYGIPAVNQRSGFTQDWNFIVQHELPGSWVLEVAYVGNNTTHDFVYPNVNDAYPVAPSNTTTPQSRRRVSTVLGNLPYYSNQGLVNYESAYINVTKRFSQGLSLLANATWSRALGEQQTQGNSFNTSSIQNPLNMHAEYGPLEYDVKDHISIGYLYELPIGRGKRYLGGASGALSQLAGGWQINGITTLQGGFPFTPTLNYSLGKTFTNSRPDYLGNAYAGAHRVNEWINPSAFQIPSSAAISAGDFYGQEGVGVVRQPGFVNFDFSIFKTFPIRESKSLVFRAEAFNLTNTPNLGLSGSVVNTVEAAGFGSVTTAGDPRVLQLALKFIF